MLMGNMSPQGKSFPTQQSMGSPYSPYAGGMQTMTTGFPSSNSMVTTSRSAPNVGGSLVMSPLLSPQHAATTTAMNSSFVPGQQSPFGTLSPPGTLAAPGSMTAPGRVTASANPSRQHDSPMNSHHAPPTGGGGDCGGAEAECTNEEECGGDDKGPTTHDTICGIDRKPLLPLGLAISTLLSGVCAVFCQVQILRRYGGIPESMSLALQLTAGGLYGLTLVLMFYCMYVDPGTVSKKQEQNPPARSHKTWLYDRHVRRFDHHCRWLLNSIALNNHREFVVMLVCLTLIGILSFALDIWIIYTAVQDNLLNKMPVKLAMVVLQFVYSAGIFYLVVPILEMHIGLISRNELAKEYTKDMYRVWRREGEEDVPANKMDIDDYNQFVDEEKQFEYSERLNPYDNGTLANCNSFWCEARWFAHQKGDF